MYSRNTRLLQIIAKNVFVFHDDLDLELGKIRCKIGGSSGDIMELNPLKMQ